MLDIEHHVHIWQVSPQLSCGDTCEIWMWCKKKSNVLLHDPKFCLSQMNYEIYIIEWTYIETDSPIVLLDIQFNIYNRVWILLWSALHQLWNYKNHFSSFDTLIPTLNIHRDMKNTLAPYRRQWRMPYQHHKNKIISLNIRGSMFFMIQLISQFCLRLRVGTGQTTSYHISQYQPCELTQIFLARRNFWQICGDETGVFRDNRVDTLVCDALTLISYCQ